MTGKAILHMLAPGPLASPFDINMALDAGFDAVIPHVNVALLDVTALVQDAMFSRPPHYAPRTGVFIGGKDALLALDMLEAARATLLAPFEISLFADPAGSFTTAAAMVASAQACLNTSLKGLAVTIFGATGVVGFTAAVLAGLEGASVTLAGHDGAGRVTARADAMQARFGVVAQGVDASTEASKRAILATTDVALCAGPAGMNILSTAMLAASPGLRLVADVNAVPPAGIEGLGLQDKGTPVGSTRIMGLGPLAIGNVKYKTESALFARMSSASRAVYLDFRDAYATARTFV
ncbi:MAG: methylenetetrahydromethanopterin dehydrogenase [Hyphomicrobiales bacterium]|nr:methylenetetrahydromethanopterin dehydrogenase [Hyphomicrobiales bacterium]